MTEIISLLGHSVILLLQTPPALSDLPFKLNFTQTNKARQGHVLLKREREGEILETPGYRTLLGKAS